MFDNYTVFFSTQLIVLSDVAISVQLPETGQHQAEVTEVSIGCSDFCNLRLERNGAPASEVNATAISLVAFNPETTPAELLANPNLTAWYGPDIPAGTPVTPTWRIPEASVKTFP